ncbi:Laccase domain protein YfiH [Methyloligella halotolerans]|uniref:Purine nucleoside phosphorylase n=1 Tax=Methyloligella halotolerans TaxID=1177755 RepID=A0A1E2RXJ0_9HYPH|nr:peptidoglycan editing factor PgeF [Methyloligella halotolerans]ODA66941.1 Laccase domain protein YfiH [Methyloligella halotolerans]
MVTPENAMLTAGPLQDAEGLTHGFFTRQGGVSGGIYESLNCGVGSKDDPANATQNRALVAAALGVAPDRLITPYQIHSATAVVAERPWEGDAPQADAIVTKMPGLAVGILTADCAPVLFADPEAKVVAAAHAGWRGAVSGIVESTVEAMRGLGATPENIVAAIGPAISLSVYEVGQDFKDSVLKDDSDAAPYFETDESTGEPHFDLSGYVADRCARAGIENVTEIGLCTYCDEARFFSYRRSQHWGEEDYGRQIAAIVLS